MLTIGSLFSGIGGLELGLEWAGLGPVKWQVEIDPFCRQVLAKHWPLVRRYKDVQTVPGGDLEWVDIVCGGFPCQDISDAHTNGKRGGLDGEKSGLWREFHRVLDVLRPEWAVVENVAAWERWVPFVRRDLRGIGYSTLPIKVSASFIGADHERPRVFVLAHADSEGEPLRAIDAQVARLSPISRSDGYWRTPPPGGFRVDDGVPNGMDRDRTLGNAVVPQVAELIGRLIRGVQVCRECNGDGVVPSEHFVGRFDACSSCCPHPRPER